MNLKVIAYIMHRLQFAVTLALFIPFLAAIYWQEPTYLDFLGTIFISCCVGVFLHNNGALEHDTLTLREGIAITGLTWILISSIGAIPFFAGHYLGLADSLFESFSGFTCTGASVIDDLSLMPKSILLWRSITHWIGGLGIIVIFIAVFPQAGNGIMKMFDAEVSGPSTDRVVPRIKTAAHALLIIYIGLSILLITLLLLCGLNLFEAVNIAFSTIATGGFGTQNASAGAYNNLGAEIVIILFMLIGGCNFGLYFMAWHKGPAQLFKNVELRIFLLSFCIISILVTIDLTNMGMDSSEALRYATFQIASVMTTTGLGTCNFDTWPAFSQFCIIILMLIGGCAGSTSGGLKVVRLMLLMKTAKAIMTERLHPESISVVKLERVKQSTALIRRVGMFFCLYVLISLVVAVIFSFNGLPIMDSLMLVFVCISNGGVAFSSVYTFSELTILAKAVCCFCMLLGRLEIFTLLAMLQRGFWRQNSNW